MKLGAQRLYKAVQNGDVGIIMLYLTSQNRGDFRYQKVYDLWVNGGSRADVLQVLFDNEPGMARWNWKYARRNKSNFDNDEFRFAVKVLESLENIALQPKPAELLKTRELVQVLVKVNEGELQLNGSSLARKLTTYVEATPDLEWPFSLASISRGLGMRLATHIYKDEAQQRTITHWFHDIHGAVLPADFSYHGWQSFLEEENYPLLKQLIPEEETLKAFFAQQTYPFEDHANNLRKNNKQWNALLQIAPWLAD